MALKAAAVTVLLFLAICEAGRLGDRPRSSSFEANDSSPQNKKQEQLNFESGQPLPYGHREIRRDSLDVEGEEEQPQESQDAEEQAKQRRSSSFNQDKKYRNGPWSPQSSGRKNIGTSEDRSNSEEQQQPKKRQSYVSFLPKRNQGRKVKVGSSQEKSSEVSTEIKKAEKVVHESMEAGQGKLVENERQYRGARFSSDENSSQEAANTIFRN